MDASEIWSQHDLAYPDQFRVDLIFDIENYVLGQVSLFTLDARKLRTRSSSLTSRVAIHVIPPSYM